MVLRTKSLEPRDRRCRIVEAAALAARTYSASLNSGSPMPAFRRCASAMAMALRRGLLNHSRITDDRVVADATRGACRLNCTRKQDFQMEISDWVVGEFARVRGEMPQRMALRQAQGGLSVGFPGDYFWTETTCAIVGASWSEHWLGGSSFRSVCISTMELTGRPPMAVTTEPGERPWDFRGLSSFTAITKRPVTRLSLLAAAIAVAPSQLSGIGPRRGGRCLRRLGSNFGGQEKGAGIHLKPRGQFGNLSLAGFLAFAAEEFGGCAFAADQGA